MTIGLGRRPLVEFFNAGCNFPLSSFQRKLESRVVSAVLFGLGYRIKSGMTFVLAEAGIRGGERCAVWPWMPDRVWHDVGV